MGRLISSEANGGAGYDYNRYLELNWETHNDSANNRSYVSWSLYARSTASSTTKYVNLYNVTAYINGVAVYSGSPKSVKKDTLLGSGNTGYISHNSLGQLSVSCSVSGNVYSGGAANMTGSSTIYFTANPVYTLSISQGTGSNITVNRTSSPAGGTGNLSAGAKKLYYGDTLKITASPSSNYSISSLTVNGTSFTSGSSTTVTGNVTVAATATPLKSIITSCPPTNIGSAMTIAVTRYSTSYTHTITWAFGSLSGTIVTKSSSTSISWTLPDSGATDLYSQIPNATSGTGTLTITTYNGNTSLGSNSYSFTAKAVQEDAQPTVTGTVEDTREDTIALTGDSSKLIAYESTALCTITATPQHSATLIKKFIGGSMVMGTTKTYTPWDNSTSIKFSAQDSRNYTTDYTKSLTVIQYIPLTINATVFRTSEVGSEAAAQINGNYFRGSFGTTSNTLQIQYRYKESTDSLYPNVWTTIPASSYTIGTKTYSAERIILGNSFDYTKSFDFQFRAIDKIYTADNPVVTESQRLSVGIPVFDWGQNDFRINVTAYANNGLYIKRPGVDTPIDITASLYDSSTIPTNGDLNNYTSPGFWMVNGDSTAATISHIPTQQAGRLYVFASQPNFDVTTNLAYLIQEYETYDGSGLYRRSISTNGSAVITYGEWVAMLKGRLDGSTLYLYT